MRKQDSIIERIVYLQRQSGLRDFAFAEKVGLTPSDYTRKVKGGNPITKKDISMISQATGVSAQWILHGEETPKEGMPEQGGYDIGNKKEISVISRLMEYLNAKGIKPGRAEKDCGFSNGLIGSAFRTQSSIGSDKIEKILSIYQDLSAEWLLRGMGTMIIGDGISPEQYFKMIGLPEDSAEIVDAWKRFMESSQDMIELFRKIK